MTFDDQMHKYQALDRWFETPQGLCVAKAFASELATVGDFFSGKQLLQLGHCGDNLWLPALNFRHKWFVTPGDGGGPKTLVASLNALPIERGSIDCVVAPLTLEAFGPDKNPLDEIDRILKPMGYVIFFGINPMSFWGAALRWGRLPCFGGVAGTLTSSLTLKSIMLQRGYTQCLHRTFYYIPPVVKEALIQKLSFFNEMGKMIWPFPAGFYCFIVQKYQPTTPSLLFDSFDNELLYLARNHSSIFVSP